MSDLRNVRVVVCGALMFVGCNGMLGSSQSELVSRMDQSIAIGDIGSPPADQSLPPDLGSDLSMGTDLSTGSDLSTGPDLTIGPPMNDLSTGRDLSTADMTARDLGASDLGSDMSPPGQCQCTVSMDGVAPPSQTETDAPVCGLGMCGLQQNEAGGIDCGGCPDPYDSCSSNQDGTYDGYCYKTYNTVQDSQWQSCGGPNQVACQENDPTYGMTYFCKSDVLYPYIPQGQSIVLCDIASISGGP